VSPMIPRVIVPPFDLESATLKVRLAEDAWNSRDPQRVSLAYSEDSEWRNRDQFLRGRDVRTVTNSGNSIQKG
jgi:nuclear transport factor 2 (NTF2) superfamily protein